MNGDPNDIERRLAQLEAVVNVELKGIQEKSLFLAEETKAIQVRAELVQAEIKSNQKRIEDFEIFVNTETQAVRQMLAAIPNKFISFVDQIYLWVLKSQSGGIYKM